MNTSHLEDSGSVVRIGNTVHREAGYWTPAVHGLLEFLSDKGVLYAPRVSGADEKGREILTFIEGESGQAGWSKVVDPEGLRNFAKLLRAYHDVVADYKPRLGVRWAYTDKAKGLNEIICHGDFGPWNVVWKGLTPVGIVDWDFAYPGPAIDDIAYAIEYTAPFRDDPEALRWLGYSTPPPRRERIEIFAEAYGLPSDAGLVDAVIRRQQLTIEHRQELIDRGLSERPNWPTVKALQERVAWSESHRSLFE